MKEYIKPVAPTVLARIIRAALHYTPTDEILTPPKFLRSAFEAAYRRKGSHAYQYTSTYSSSVHDSHSGVCKELSHDELILEHASEVVKNLEMNMRLNLGQVFGVANSFLDDLHIASDFDVLHGMVLRSLERGRKGLLFNEPQYTKRLADAFLREQDIVKQLLRMPHITTVVDPYSYDLKTARMSHIPTVVEPNVPQISWYYGSSLLNNVGKRPPLVPFDF